MNVSTAYGCLRAFRQAPESDSRENTRYDCKPVKTNFPEHVEFEMKGGI